MADTAAIEGTAVDLPVTDHNASLRETSTAVVRRERRSEVIRPLATDQLVESFAAYQALLPQLLDDGDYQAADGKPFVKKSGWRKIATAFDLDVQLIRSVVDRDEHGQAQRAEVWARAIAPSGRSMDGDGYCSVDESRFGSTKGRAKLENDLRATATTRAKNRAISDLVGMGAVSAEEVESPGGQRSDTGPPHGPQVTQELGVAASSALTALTGGDAGVARGCWEAIKRDLGGYMPHAAAVVMIAAAAPLTSGEDSG